MLMANPFIQGLPCWYSSRTGGYSTVWK